MVILLRYEIPQIPLWNSCHNCLKETLNTSHRGFLLSPWNVPEVNQGDFSQKNLCCPTIWDNLMFSLQRKTSWVWADGRIGAGSSR